MTNVFHRHCHADLPTAVGGDGPYIFDRKGKVYLDGSSGAAVSCLGHSNKEVQEAVTTQIHTMPFAHTGFFTNEPMEKLAEFLVQQAGGTQSNVYFFSGGSEAVEGALKLAVQYFQEIGKPNKTKIIARKQSYHGNTIGALSAGGNAWRRTQFEGILVEMSHIDPCYAYRYQKEGETPEAYGKRAAGYLEDEIIKQGAENVAAFIMEPVVGATLGAVPAEVGYLQEIRRICTKYDVLLILDEVMCGMGRTGHLFAHHEDNVEPDIVTIAKGLGAGYQPIGATLVSKTIYDTIYHGTGFFQHGHTYIGHATACAAALKVQEIIQRDNLLDNVQKLGVYLKEKLHHILADHPHVGDIRGRGLFVGVECVADKATKSTFDSALKIHANIKKTAMQNGLMCYPMGGTIDGKNGDHVLFAPPFICTEQHMDELVAKFQQTLDEVLQQEALAA